MEIEEVREWQAQNSDQEYVALTRLARFIKSANQKLERLECVLPSPTVPSPPGLPRQGLSRLRQRGRRFLRWSKVEREDGEAAGSGDKSGDQGFADTRSETAFYRFLKRTTEELTPVLAESDNETVVMGEGEAQGVGDGDRAAGSKPSFASPLLKFSQIYDDHFTRCSSSSSTTLHSVERRDSHQARSSSQNSSDSAGLRARSSNESDPRGASLLAQELVLDEQYEDVDAEQVIQTLDFLDKHLDLFIEDPSSIKKTIEFYNWDNACDIGQNRHLHFYELPFPWRENRYIIHGYRFYDSHFKSLLSVVNWYGWHNETLNIWSHLFGAAYLLYVLLCEFPASAVFLSQEVPFFGKLMVQIFLLAGIKCLTSSSIWHTLNGTCCLPLRSKFACIDYTGITVLITASILSTEFVTVYNVQEKSLSPAMSVYMGASLMLGVFGSVMNWSPKFDRPESRPFRIGFYVLLAGLGMLSFLHLTVCRGLSHSSVFFKPVWNRSLIWYLIGVAFYGSFIPERWRTDVELDCAIPTNAELCSNLDILTKHKHVHFRPTPSKRASKSSFLSLWWVDYCLSSHTIWHTFVLLGVIGHYRALLDMFATKWQI